MLCKDITEGRMSLKLKGHNYNPTISEVASLLESDIRHTWIFANLKNTLLSSQKICEKI